MRKAVHIACLMLMLVLAACAAGGGNDPLATQAIVLPASSDTPAPQPATSYPGAGSDQPTGDIGYPPPGDTPGPASGYPAEVLTQTAKAPTATLAPSPSKTIDPTAANTLTPGPPTITPFPVSKSQPELPPPCDIFQGRDSYPTPDLTDLRWENVRVDGKPFARLTGLSAPSGPAQPSLDGRGVALSIFLSFDNVSLSGVYGLLVVDGPGGNPWWAVESAMSGELAYQWLPGNRLLWIDKGELYSALANGSKKVSYHAPEPVFQMWSNGSEVMVSGRQHLWLLDLAAGTWIVKIENFASPFTSAALTPDGNTLLINNSGELIQVPMDPRGEVIRYKPLAYAGSGGGLPAPVAMAGGPYIYPGLIELAGGEDPKFRFVVFKVGTYEPVELEGLIGKAEVHSIYGIDVSPDGNWVLFPFNGSDQATQEMQYLAPSVNLQAGRVVTGSKLGWRVNPASVLLTDGKIIRQVSLPSYEEKILGRFALLNEMPDLTDTSVGSNVTVVRINNRLHLFDAYGNFKEQIDLPHHPRQVYAIVPGINDTITLTGWDGSPNGDFCDTTYWMEIFAGGK